MDNLRKMNAELLLQLNNNEQNKSTLEGLVRLIEKGADVNLKNYVGKTALMTVCSFRIHYDCEDFEGVISRLIELGSDVNIKDDDNNTALIWASWAGNIGIVKQLIKVRGVELNAQDSSGSTAIMQTGSLKCLQVLLDAGADVNIVDAEGDTLFTLAKTRRSEEICNYLVIHVEKTEKKASQERSDEVSHVLTGVFGR